MKYSNMFFRIQGLKLFIDWGIFFLRKKGGQKYPNLSVTK